MKSTKISLFLALVLLATASLKAQDFLEPSFSFSGKKIAYLTMMDGSEKQVYVKNIDRKKGLIEEIKIEDESGKKSKLKPEQIKHMYLPQSGWDKMNKALDQAYDAQKWDNDALDPNKFKEGYVYFEQAEVMVKKKKMTMLMQLLNPAFCTKIKVYHDPYAGETASLGVGPLTMAGGDEKSYYVSVRGQTAFKLQKKNYDEEFNKMYGMCSTLKAKFDKIKWSEFNEHVYEHYMTCE
ncbi:MAG: hypothetical protein GC192_05765 [Bacteroidetes bacterium]|nr:hypothetical protein [Bacteroidota bacterium]